MKIADQFPDLYRSFLPDFFNIEIDREEIADCVNCVMLKPEKPLPEQEYFSDNSKCCTFFPDIPNYLAGYLLSDCSEKFKKGRDIMTDIILSGVGVTPKGISAGKRYSYLYKISRENSFGKSKELICPFYDQKKGYCSMWKARTAVCTSYFCRYNNGKNGENFWSAVKDYMRNTERILSDFAIYKVGSVPVVDVEPPRDDFLLADVDNIKPADYDSIWGEWSGREIDFYIRSLEVIKALSKEDFTSIMGFTGTFYISKIEQCLDVLNNPVIPEVMILNPEIHIRPYGTDEFLLVSEAGVFKISGLMFKVLTSFDGTKNTNNIKQYYNAEGVDIEDDLLISFYQHRILIPTNK